MTASSIANARYHLDHDMFAFRTLREEINFALPQAARIGVALTIVLQRFHLDAKAPFAIPGTLDRPFPDVGNAAQREVGLRSGLWRICEFLERQNIAATFAVESDALELLGSSLEVLKNAKHAVVAGGKHATLLHTESMDVEAERQVIRESREQLERTLGRRISGWRSPCGSQSRNTLQLLADNDFAYCGDFQNDDRPYVLHTKTSPLVAVPMHYFSSDLHNIFVMKQPTPSYFSAFYKGAEWLLTQANGPAVVLPLVVHPWISGVPHRFVPFRETIAAVRKLDKVAFVNADTIATSLK